MRSIRDADRARDPRVGAQVSLFRFGSRLAAVDGGLPAPEARSARIPGQPGAAVAAEPRDARSPRRLRPTPTRSWSPRSKG